MRFYRILFYFRKWKSPPKTTNVVFIEKVKFKSTQSEEEIDREATERLQRFRTMRGFGEKSFECLYVFFSQLFFKNDSNNN